MKSMETRKTGKKVREIEMSIKTDVAKGNFDSCRFNWRCIYGII